MLKRNLFAEENEKPQKDDLQQAPLEEACKIELRQEELLAPLGQQQRKINLESNLFAANILGSFDENLTLIQKSLGVRLAVRGKEATAWGSPPNLEKTEQLLGQLLVLAKANIVVTAGSVNYALGLLNSDQQPGGASNSRLFGKLSQTLYTTPRGKQIKAKTLGQSQYLSAIANHDITFGVGPAGTGKTYLAVVMGVEALKKKRVAKIVLVRPAIEAGEKLGFLPGDLQEKVNPYLRPVYDALDDVLGQELTAKYIEKTIIEVVPLAYMRGRTLEDAFIILDEAQNTTPQQMKMFLTRMGVGSKAVITGDITQIDLPGGQTSGLNQAIQILKDINEIAFYYLTTLDVVRHPLVQKIINAYEQQ